MRDIRNGTDRHFCGLLMLTGLRITVRNPVPVFSRRQAWRSIYGNDICFPDLMHAQTVLVWSNNLYHSNVGMARPYQSLKARGAKIMSHVDPRETVTTQAADIHLKLLPGTDGALALSMAQVIIEEGLYDKEFVEKYVYGFEEYKAYVNQFPPEKSREDHRCR